MRPGLAFGAIALLGLVLLGGCTLVGAPLPGAPAHHREHGFANPSGKGGAQPVDFLLDRLRLAFAGPEQSPAPVLPPGAAAALWAQGEGDQVQWLGHATLRLRLAGVVLLVDPVFAPVVTPLPPFGPPRASPPPLGVRDLADVAAVLVSHDHYDHFEPATVNALARGGARCFLPLRVAAGEGLDCAVTELDWGEAARLDPLLLTLQPAQHESGRGLFDRDRSLWGAWLIEGGGKRVYVSGDGGYGAHFAALGAVAGGIDLAVLSVGGYAPRRTNSGVHMDPEESVQAFLDLGARRALVVHWGTYPLGLESGGETVERVTAAAAAAGLPPDAILFLAIGEVLAF